MKQIFTLTFVLFTLLFQSCRDNLNVPTPASRNYEQDVAVLNDFVDINKTTHEYYVNSNKHTSVLSYIKNSAVEELNSVNLLNFEIFNKSLSRINQISEQLISIVGTAFAILALLGFVNDPTTAGIYDSSQALTYEKPKKDK